MPAFLRLFRRKKASSLVTTLFVVTVLTVIVVAFLQSMTIERMTSKSYANIERARLAAEAGVNEAQTLLELGIGTNFGYATILTNVAPGTNAPFVLIVSGVNKQQMTPLVSGSLNNLLPGGATNDSQLLAYLSNSLSTNPAASVNLNTRIGNNYLITDESTAPRFGAAWTYVTNSAGQTNARFAFVLVDEQGKINLAVHGGTNSTNRVGWNHMPASMPVSIPGNPAYLGSTNGALDFPKTNILSYAQIGQAFSNRPDYEAKKHLYTFHQIPSAAIIPAGSYSTNTNNTFRAYPNAHQPKFNINDLATNPTYGATSLDRATNIAAIIDTNLPGFKTRDVAFEAAGRSSEQIRYVQRIAASIVDYIDSDTTSTVMADGEPAGKELAPVITSIAEKYNWISEAGSGSLWTNQIKTTVYVELWNPYQTNVSGNFAIELFTPNESGRFRYIQLPGAVQEPMETVKGTNAIALRPNEFKVIEAGAATNVVISSVQASLIAANHPRMPETASTNTAMPLHSRFSASWNGVLVDKTPNDSPFLDSTGPGLTKEEVGGSDSTRISLNGTSRFSINYPQVVFSDPSQKGFRSVGDPRQNALSNYVWSTRPQTDNRILWNGRNNLSVPTGTGGTGSQNFAATFASRDPIRENPPLGVFTGNSDPTTASQVWSASDVANSIAFIRNAPMGSIGELGNIYDPVHLNDVGFATRGGNPESWFASGGGRTLRIGQQEFIYPTTNAALTPSGNERRTPEWNVDDRRAVSFLDLFTAIPGGSNNIPKLVGKININTAHRDVLAALFNQIGQDADRAFTNSRLTANASFTLADTVISNRPYFRLGEIYKFTTNLLASTNFSPALGPTSTNVALVMDPGREQILSGLIEGLDVRSQAFQVFVIGEALDNNGKVLARSLMRAILAVDISRTNPSSPLKATIEPVYVQQF